MMNMSKKGQGLALISIIVLIAILYFVFRYNTQSYNFLIDSGDEQAHLITAYTESAKAHSFVQLSARQAAFETIWNLSKKGTGASALTKCTDADFNSTFKSLFDIYSAMYEPTTDLIQTTIPDYKFNFTCPASSSGMVIEGWGYAERCTLANTFPFPQYPCEDQANKTDCEAVKFTQSTTYNNKHACTWTADLNCTDSLPAPDCSSANNADECDAIMTKDNSKYCGWQISYSEPISIVSAPLINYQFSIDSDAHFIENISGSEYAKFATARKKAFLPSCSITLPAAMVSNAKFNISVKYVDDGSPNSIDLTVRDVTVDLTSGSYEVDTNDKIYDNGKDYYYAVTLANNTYSAEVTCTDSDGNKVTTKKDFTVSSA